MEKIAIFSFIVVLVFLGVSNCLEKDVQTFTLDLDAEPVNRWPPVIQAMGPAWIEKVKISLDTVIETAINLIPAEEQFLVNVLLRVDWNDVNKYLPYPYAEEMLGISEAANISIGQLLFVNYVYEMNAFTSLGVKACTSIVGQNTNNKIFHGRNLDFYFTDQLRVLTINVNFTRNGKLHFHGATFLGLTGLITGSAPGRFAISFNERYSGTFTENVQNALNGGRTSEHEVRYVLDVAPDYDTAVKMLTTAHTIAPEYFIVSGVMPGQGCVITGDRDRSVDVYPLALAEGRWYLVETNYDRWTTPPPNDDRRDPAIRDMNLVGQSRFDAKTLFGVLSVPPVLNHFTVYTTIMSAAEPDLFYTKIRYDEREM